jgi:hypothetical protein
MAKTKRRSRNIARKPKSHAPGFVPQNANASSSGFVSQTGEQPSNLAPNTAPEPGFDPLSHTPGFVPQNPIRSKQPQQAAHAS